MADKRENEMKSGSPSKVRGIDGNGGSILFDLSEIGLINRGDLPALGVNIIGDPSTVKRSIYGWYNNSSGDRTNSYAPSNSAGLFLRLYVKDDLAVTLFLITAASGKNTIWILADGDKNPTQI